jgi:nicotinamide riboside kinase
VTKIWSDVKYGRCDPWIINQIRCRKYDLFLLCDIDLPWEFDPMREHPHNRQFLFDLYERELRLQNKPYRVIRGIGDQRLAGAVRVMEDFFRD